MGSNAEMEKPHAMCIPYPAQGHINPMTKLAKLLHSEGFHISFVNTHYNHNRLLRSRGPSSLDGLPDFRFYSIPDGLPPSDAEATQSIPELCETVPKHSLEPICDLITELNSVLPVSCIVSDGCMSFTLEAAKRFGLPEVLFWTTSACGLLAYTRYRDLVQKGYTPLKGGLVEIREDHVDEDLNEEKDTPGEDKYACILFRIDDFEKEEMKLEMAEEDGHEGKKEYKTDLSHYLSCTHLKPQVTSYSGLRFTSLVVRTKFICVRKIFVE